MQNMACGGYKRFDDLIADARKNRGALTFGYSSATTQVLGAATNTALGMQVVPVPYKASTEAVNDLVGNRLSYIVIDVGVSAPLAKAGRITPLAVLMPRRSAMMPDVPTIAELGKPGVELVAWTGFCGPRGLPDEATNWLKTAL